VVEQLFRKQQVVGSIPTTGSIFSALFFLPHRQYFPATQINFFV
ncbi:uncharacterized protein METZ01_LOCUS99537, partial [marine metagenome]